MPAPKNWNRQQEKEDMQHEFVWTSNNSMEIVVVDEAPRRGESMNSKGRYTVYYIDRKIYGAPISNRKKFIAQHSNKDEIRSALTDWMDRHENPHRSDFESLQRHMRAEL